MSHLEEILGVNENLVVVDEAMEQVEESAPERKSSKTRDGETGTHLESNCQNYLSAVESKCKEMVTLWPR